MAPSDELEYLKTLVNQLNEKIKSLEERAKSAVKPKTPAQQLRTILVGPPGSGSSSSPRLCNKCTKRRVILFRQGHPSTPYRRDLLRMSPRHRRYAS